MKSISRPFLTTETHLGPQVCWRQRTEPEPMANSSSQWDIAAWGKFTETHHSDSAGSRIAPKQDSARLSKVHYTGVLLTRTQHSCMGKTNISKISGISAQL